MMLKSFWEYLFPKEKMDKKIKIRVIYYLFFAGVTFFGMAFLLLGYNSIVKYNEETRLGINAEHVANCMADVADPCLIQEIIDGKYSSEDPAYKEAFHKILAAQRITQAKYVYIMVHVKDNKFRYILDSSNGEVLETGNSVDDVTTWGRPGIIDTYNTGKPTHNRVHVNEQYGELLTAFAPIMKDGQLIAIVGVDFEAGYLDDITNGALKTVLPFFLLIMLVCAGSFDILFGRKCCARGMRCTDEEDDPEGEDYTYLDELEDDI